MNNFYAKAKEAFSTYGCRLYDDREITFTPKAYLIFGVLSHTQFTIENFINQLNDFLKDNTCPCDHMTIKFKNLIKDRFNEYNCYGFLISRTGIDDVGIEHIIIKNFNKNEIINTIMKDVHRESFIHIIDIDVKFW
jgi:hypothetical protein